MIIYIYRHTLYKKIFLFIIIIINLKLNICKFTKISPNHLDFLTSFSDIIYNQYCSIYSI